MQRGEDVFSAPAVARRTVDLINVLASSVRAESADVGEAPPSRRRRRVDRRPSRRQDGSDVFARETLRGTAELHDAVVEVLGRHGEVGPIELSEEDLEELAEAAEALRPVFLATRTDDAAERLNDLLAEASPPRLTSHENRTTWHLHVDRDDDGPWGEWLLTSGALSLATLLTERQQPPGGVCAAPDCDRVFLIHGRGGPRRFCSPRCTTRTRVARHRSTQM